jgi:HSP20 family protein
MAAETKHKNESASTSTSQPVQKSAAQDRDRPVNRRDWDRDWERSSFSPFSIMRQGLDEIERWAGQLGFGRGFASGPSWSSSGGRGFLSQSARHLGDWSPAIDAFQRGNEFVVRAEAPGMNRNDLTVEIGDDTLTIHGERKRELDDERDGIFWTERSYGSFTRVVPLPPGAIADSAKASFNNGILEVVMQAPSPEARRGRRLDISGAQHEEKESSKK